MNKVIHLLWFSGLLAAVGLTGYLLGRIVDTRVAYSTPPLQLVPDTRPKVPTVIIGGIRNGELYGSTTGSGLRLFLQDDYILLSETGAFQYPAYPALSNEIIIHVPEGMHYVASKRGKKYYDVNSAGGQRIAPENRVYFATGEEAEGEGYRP